jgi:predicted esterase
MSDFIILQAEQSDKDPFIIKFFCTDHGTGGDEYYIGNIMGNPYTNEAFNRRLQRIRGRLDMKNMQHYGAWSRVNLKEIRKQDDEEKYKRKLGKVMREYERRKREISLSLFHETQMNTLEADLKVTIETLKKQYNQV